MYNASVSRPYLCGPVSVQLAIDHLGSGPVALADLSSVLQLSLPQDVRDSVGYGTASADPNQWGVHFDGETLSRLSEYLLGLTRPLRVLFLNGRSIGRQALAEDRKSVV